MKSIEKLKDDLNKNDFDPWDYFQLYGSYSSDFDEMAITALKKLTTRDWHEEQNLSTKMFYEMLCMMNWCDYGTSPRYPWPTPEFAEVLPALIEKWEKYSASIWDDDEDD